jgi:hypothetical protein
LHPRRAKQAVQQHARRELGTALDVKATSRADLGTGKRGRGAWHPGQGAADGGLRAAPLDIGPGTECGDVPATESAPEGEDRGLIHLGGPEL